MGQESYLVRAAVRKLLLAHGSLSAFGDRIHPRRTGNNPALPYAVFDTIHSEEGLVHGGCNGFRELLLQFSIFTDGPAIDLENYSEWFRNVLHGYAGYFDDGADPSPSPVSDGIRIAPIRLESEADLDGEPLGVIGRAQDYRIHYVATT